MNRLGERLHTMTIVSYTNANNIDVMFEDGNIKRNVKYCHFKYNNIKNNYKPLVFGVGYFGEGKYSAKEHRKIYQTWLSMMQRCYSEELKKIRPTYIGCTVTNEWHNFQVFAKWFNENYIDGFHLDKDLTILGNKMYSPDTCRFIPFEINSLLTDSGFSRGKLPIGVSLHKTGKYQSSISNNNKKVYLGLFDNIEEAYEVYKKAKKKYIETQAKRFRAKIGDVIYNNLINYKI